MSLDFYEDVLDFHSKFGCAIGREPANPDPATTELRINILLEEVNETIDAMRAGDIVEVADGLCDIIYVTLGAAITYGIDLQPIWDEIHRSNMAKEGGAKREDGKILKPAGWQPPRVAEILAQQIRSR